MLEGPIDSRAERRAICSHLPRLGRRGVVMADSLARPASLDALLADLHAVPADYRKESVDTKKKVRATRIHFFDQP